MEVIRGNAVAPDDQLPRGKNSQPRVMQRRARPKPSGQHHTEGSKEQEEPAPFVLTHLEAPFSTNGAIGIYAQDEAHPDKRCRSLERGFLPAG